jgi:serine/threonine protein kinase
MIIGDLRYMAPEQLLGKTEVRSDIFSLGSLIYELLLGEQPRLDQRAELFERLHRDPSLSQRLTEVVKKCLAESPSERYASAHDLADSLRGFMASATPQSRTQRQVVALHGIRTYAGWQRALSEVADEASWRCRSDRWNFGYFSAVRFFQPWSRSAKVEWFRRTYREEFSLGVDSGAELPSIVAHSFGTYILGNALLRYPYLRFNKVLVCGSILPVDFPWAALLDSGQVQSVRNEYGARDFWTGLVEHFIPGTGASGRIGFKLGHPRLEQERFEFSHSEYFERSHMEGRWIPFLSRAEAFVAPRGRPERVKMKD